MTPNSSSLRDAALFLSLLMQPGDVFELRGLVRFQGQQQTWSGYFDNVDDLARAAIDRSGKDDGVYVTLNPAHPGLLARAPKNKARRAGTGDTTSDRDVRVRRSILIDADPVRPAGISSTDEEHTAALDLVAAIAADLSAMGWPMPIVADSGNGGHLIYAVDLPVDDGGLVKRVLEQLSRKYTTKTLKIDEKVFNPARISKIYGTLTRKGENTEDRPHRVARILSAPAKLEIVARERLEAFAPESKGLRDLKQKVDRYTGERSTFDIDAWISRHLPDAIAQSWSEGRKWLLPVCPFNDQHDRKEAYITEKHGGQLAAGCQHESCFKTWKELRERFEPDAYAHRNGNGHNGTRRTSDRQDPPEVVYQDEQYDAITSAEIDRQADNDRDPLPIVTPGKPKPAWRRAPELVDAIWERKDDPWIGLQLGPDEICRIRAGGIAVVMGGSGSGKSSLVSSMLLHHARNAGPAIALSIELPADELAARIVGILCDASWEEALRGQVDYERMTAALAIPRLYVLDRKNATIENLNRCVDAARAEYPGEPILAAIDYAQLLQSKEREVRMKVADAFAQVDDSARDKRYVAIAVSQMGRASAVAASSGEKIGADTAALGAESAAIERFATVTIAIGQKGEPREDGSAAVEVSLGKGRMSGGDVVYPASYWGRSGLWRLSGESKRAADVRTERDTEKESRLLKAIENQLIGAAQKSAGPLSREQLMELVTGRKVNKKTAIAQLIASGDLVEVNRRAPRSRSWTVWTPDRVNTTPGLQLVRDMPEHDR